MTPGSRAYGYSLLESLLRARVLSLAAPLIASVSRLRMAFQRDPGADLCIPCSRLVGCPIPYTWVASPRGGTASFPVDSGKQQCRARPGEPWR